MGESMGFEATQKCLDGISNTLNEAIYISVLNHLQEFQNGAVEDDSHLIAAENELGRCQNQSDSYFYLLQAVTRLIRGNVSEFKSSLDKALELNPYNPVLNYYRWLAGYKENDSFAVGFEPLKKLSSNYLLLGLYYVNLDKQINKNSYDKAGYYFDLALKIIPRTFTAVAIGR
jgi:hypothetical protein